MLPQGRPHGLLVPLAVGLVVVAAHSQVQQPASPRSADRVGLLEAIHGGSASCGLYQLFEFTSLSIPTSKLRSATTFFSSVFSRSSCLSRWS